MSQCPFYRTEPEYWDLLLLPQIAFFHITTQDWGGCKKVNRKAGSTPICIMTLAKQLPWRSMGIMGFPHVYTILQEHLTLR